MKKIATTGLYLIIYIAANCQVPPPPDPPGAVYELQTVYTPNGTSITAWKLLTGDWSQLQKDSLKLHWLSHFSNRISFIEEATWSYNCHAYAWLVSEGGEKVWVQTPGDDTFWNDGSFYQVSNPSEATKVSFASDDHSAITTDNPSYLISKWGNGPLFRHRIEVCPYISNNLVYYKKIVFDILGASQVCSLNETFSLNNLPSTCSVVWSCSDNISYVSGQGTATYTVKKANMSLPGSGWIQAVVSSPGMNGITIRKKITVGTPLPNVFGPIQNGVVMMQPCIGTPTTYIVSPVNPDITTFRWRLYGNDYTTIFPNRSYATFGVNYQKKYTLTVEQYSEQCGWSGMITKYFYGTLCENAFSVSPNPVLTEITVAKVESPNKTSEFEKYNETIITVNSIKVFDQSGNLRLSESYKNATNATLNVSALRKGIYIVLINDTENHTIVKE